MTIEPLPLTLFVAFLILLLSGVVMAVTTKKLTGKIFFYSYVFFAFSIVFLVLFLIVSKMVATV